MPTAVTEGEREWLIGHGITTVVDLRTDAERQRKECPLINDGRFSYHCRAVTGGDAVPGSADAVSRSYIAMVDDELLQTVELITSAQSNVLYFCNAGKDRTGVVSAILLLREGMTEEYIVADYLLSRENLREKLQAFARQEPWVDINVITPCERYIREFLDWYRAEESGAQ